MKLLPSEEDAAREAYGLWGGSVPGLYSSEFPEIFREIFPFLFRKRISFFLRVFVAPAASGHISNINVRFPWENP